MKEVQVYCTSEDNLAMWNFAEKFSLNFVKKIEKKVFYHL